MSAVVVALDGLGGDHAPGEPLAAASAVDPETCTVMVIDHGDARSSLREAAQLVADGRAAALVSAGATGATVTVARRQIGRLAGVRRPALAARLPFGSHGVVLCDAGVNLNPSPTLLAEHARLGAAYARALGVTAPRVGVLNVARESGRGPTAVRALAQRLKDWPAFGGFVEPADVIAGAVDVVVSDGFAGNILLKSLEALVPPPAASPGAALLLGVRRPVLVAHGAAERAQLAGALRMAAATVVDEVIPRLAALLAPDAVPEMP